MVGLSDGEKTFRICVTVYAQYRRVTDRQTDILPRHSPRYAYALRGKNAQNYLAPAAPPRNPLGELTALPQTP